MKKRVVIADDDRDLVRALARRCRQLGLVVETAADGFEAGFEIFLTWENTNTPDLIILDVNMPVDDGLSICEELLREPSLALLPVIILTGRNDKATIRRCEELGAHYVYKSGDVWEALKPIICELLNLQPETEACPEPAKAAPARLKEAGSASRRRTKRRAVEAGGTQKRTILWIDDDRDFLIAMQMRLKPHGFDVLPAETGLQGFLTALKERPDLIITDYVMPEGYGSYVVRRLKEHHLTRLIPVFVVTGRDLQYRVTDRKDPAMERQFRRIGAEGVFTKPVDVQNLMKQIRKRVNMPDEGGAEADVEAGNVTEPVAR